ncbi:hypothetical protein EVAR_25378_1 [Eumeta japonica]|uniref:Uncharacterized protein n=1 Tax=Eumeta variegata TaxID=151549 RepID=A0A4C1V6B5_EUMVA|nr:hypothetical protein EVAR_25378_1 [Eumeta japonica]
MPSLPFFIAFSRGKRASGSSEIRWPPPPMNIRNHRLVTGAIYRDEIRYLMEGESRRRKRERKSEPLELSFTGRYATEETAT